jgi:perosamine synthetase
MTGMQAAMGVVQTRRIESVIEAKRKMAASYNRALAGLEWLQGPAELDWARNVYWMYAVAIRAGSGVDRRVVLEHLQKVGVETRTFFCPMNLQPALQRLAGFRNVPCPVAEGLWERGFYLPSSTKLTDDDIGRIASALSDAGRLVGAR